MKNHLGKALDVTGRTADHGGIAVFELAGEVDMTTAEEPLAEALNLLGRAPAGLVVDLKAVSFFGSSGINLLLTVKEQVQRQNIPLAVVADQQVVLRPLTLTGVDTQFALFPSVANAVVALHELPAQTRRQRSDGAL